MRTKTRQITQTALLLALLIALQWCTKPFGQLVTGSCVNMVLAVSALLGSLWSGLFIALFSPIFAFLLGIAPQLVTVPAIMAGNAALVLILHWGAGKKLFGKLSAVLTVVLACAAKFLLLYVLVVLIICGPASAVLLEKGLLKAPMLTALPAMFAWPQLFTALIGSTLASILVPVLKKATHK